jgi:hypothetical protein
MGPPLNDFRSAAAAAVLSFDWHPVTAAEMLSAAKTTSDIGVFMVHIPW